MFPLIRKITENRARGILRPRARCQASPWQIQLQQSHRLSFATSTIIPDSCIRSLSSLPSTSVKTFRNQSHNFVNYDRVQIRKLSAITTTTSSHDTYKNETISGILQDLPNVREEIVAIIEEEEEREKLERDEEERLQRIEDGIVDEKEEVGGTVPEVDAAPIFPQKQHRTLRLRYSESWKTHCYTRDKLLKKQQQRRKTNTAAANNKNEWESMFHQQGWDASQATTIDTDNNETSFMGFEDDLLDVASEQTIATTTMALSDALANTSTVAAQVNDEPAYDDRFSAFGRNKGDAIKGEILIDQFTTATVVQEEGSPIAQPNAVREEVDKMCFLLERSTPRDWKLFDAFIDNDDFDTHEMSADTEDETSLVADDNMIEENIEHPEDDISDDGFQELLDLEHIFELLEDPAPLSIDEYNLLLARIATSPESSAEEIMSGLLEIYYKITKCAVPDENTYRILLSTLERRISAGTRGSCDATVVTLLQDMMNFNIKLSSPLILYLGMRCLERENNLVEAQRLVIDHVLDDKQRKFNIPAKITKTLMAMIARENELETAISLLKKCVKENGKQGSRHTDQLVDAAIRWPVTNRAGQRRDICHVLTAIRDVMMNNKTKYEPGFFVWRNLIVALSRSAAMDPARWELLRQPYHSLFHPASKFFPDEHVLRLGLEYSVETKDAQLAQILVVKAVDNHVYRSEEAAKLDLATQPSRLSSILSDFAQGTSNSAQSADEEVFPGFTIDSSGFLNDMSLAKKETEDTDDDVFGDPVMLSHADWGEQRPLFSATSIDLQNVVEGPDTPTDDAGENKATATNQESSANNDSGAVIKPTKLTPFSFKVFQNAISVCHAANDMESGQGILDALERLSDVYPKNIQSSIWSFALQGFASLAHDADSVKRMFDSMQNKDVQINEESYGAILHSLAIGKRPGEVSDLFQSLKSKSSTVEGAVTPGVSCYNAVMLSHLNNKAWKDVLSLHGEMKEAGLTPNEKTTQGLLLASYRLGGSDQVRDLIRDILSANAVVISQQNCHLALKMLMPGLFKRRKITKTNYTVDDIQDSLRDVGDKHEAMKTVCLNLLRSFRQADIEQKRLPTKNAPLEVLVKRRELAWQAALQDILEAAQAQTILKNEMEEEFVIAAG